MTQINKNSPIMITGATGYVAGWIVKKLLDEGHTVHAPIRDSDNSEKTKFLNELAKNSSGNIKYFEADLLIDGSYEESMKECELVIHTASPFINKVKNPQKDLVDPAVRGTSNVLNSASKVDTIKRIVLTSSVAAIYGDAQDILDYPNQMLTEESWNTSSSLHHQSYSFSKVSAEKKAWEIANAQSKWDLVVVNPSLVLGPGINPKSTSESLRIIKQMGDGTMRFGAPDYRIGAVDVRDLAIIHYNAGFIPEANGRNIASAENTGFIELARMLEPKFQKKYPLPKNALPKWLVVLMAPVTGFKRKVMRNNVGFEWKADNSKAIRELQASYRPMKETINEYFQQLIDTNVI